MEEIDAATAATIGQVVEGHDEKPDRLRAPFIVNLPHSKKADKDGLRDGKLITTYAKDAVNLIETRDHLQDEINYLIKKVPETTVEIMHFENWAKTNKALLLHVKPSQADQVVAIVKGVISLNKKGVVTVGALTNPIARRPVC